MLLILGWVRYLWYCLRCKVSAQISFAQRRFSITAIFHNFPSLYFQGNIPIYHPPPPPPTPVYSGGCGMENKNFSNFWSILASFVKLDILGTPCILSDTPCDSWMFCRRAMFSLLGDVKGLIKLDKLCIDNNVFRLHYKVRLPKHCQRHNGPRVLSP